MLSTGFVDKRLQAKQDGRRRVGSGGEAMKVPWRLIKYLPMAQKVLARGRLPAVLIAVARKSSSRGGVLKELRSDLALLQALCVAWWRGDYRAVSTSALVAVVAGLLYFLAPLDAVPDWIPGLGFLDDLAVLGWVMRKWSVELEAFRVWRDSQSTEVREDLKRLPAADEPKAE